MKQSHPEIGTIISRCLRLNYPLEIYSEDEGCLSSLRSQLLFYCKEM